MASNSSIESTAQFGVIGLGVMGQNLALNVRDHGLAVAVWNLETEVIDQFLNQNGPNSHLIGTPSLREFTEAIARPRRILMMIKAGSPVDEMLQKLAPLLSPEDIVIDGGNSLFKDTQRREAEWRGKFNFFGMGVSGGEDGARYGPSLMPGGARKAYDHVKPILESIAAKSDSGPCVTYVGPDGAGHFVKMVHNGIEYGDMQLIAEAYDLLRHGLGLEAGELSQIFAGWNTGKLESYLIDITSQVLSAVDPVTGHPLVDMVLDKAGQKGTGKWTAMEALDLGIPIPTIAAAIDARVLSSMKDQRVAAAAQYGKTPKHYSGDKQSFIGAILDALYAAKVCSYAQGMSLIRAGSDEFKWDINLGEMARIWKAGCIIRARLLNSIMEAYHRRPDLPNLLLDFQFQKEVSASQRNWRQVVSSAAEIGIPIPAMSASLAYFDSYTSASLPQNLTQAQRDYFGAHTYQRVDNPNGDFIHSEWKALIPTAGEKR